MSPLKASIIAALISATLTGGGFYHLHKKNAREAARLRSQNNRIRYAAYLNHQKQLSPTSDQNSQPTGEKVSINASEIPAGKPAENYRNEGQLTPRATLQTFAWACDRGDTEAVASLIYLNDAARAKAEAWLTSLPESERSKWKSVEQLTAAHLALTVMAGPLPNADVLDVANFESVSENQATFRLPGTRHDQTQLQKSGDTWRVVVTPEKIEKLAKLAEEIASAK